MKNVSNVILVGGFGFVGRNILAALKAPDMARWCNPVVIDDLSNAAPGFADCDVSHCIASYRDTDAADFLNDLDETRPRIFVFLAGETRVAESAERPLDFIRANIEDPAAFVEDVLREHDHFVLVSTAGALFDGSFEVRNSSPYCPKNFYGATKASEEMVLRHLVEMRGAQFSVVRLTNVYGPFSENKKSAIHAFTRAAVSDDEVTINGDGRQSRDFVYSGDVGQAIVRHLARIHHGQVVRPINTIGSGSSTSLLDVVGAINAASGRSLKCNYSSATSLLASEPRDVRANTKDAHDLLQDKKTPLPAGIALTYAYYADCT